MRLELTTLVVIGTDCTGSCKSNYHTITPTMISIINIKINFTLQYLIDINFYANISNYVTICEQQDV